MCGGPDCAQFGQLTFWLTLCRAHAIVPGQTTEPAMKTYFYQIEFVDGRVVRREGVSRSMAQSVYNACEYEMILLNVKRVSWGKIEKS